MAPQPKRKHSQQRGRVRAMALKTKLAQLIACPSCRELMYPHSVCPHCGFYDGRLVFAKKEKQQQTKENENAQ